MPASIFAGSKVKTLKSTLSLNGGADIISSTTNPQTSAVSAEPGSLLLNTTSGIMYRKLDAGSTTNWVEVGAGSGGKNYIKNPDFDGGSTTNWSMQKVSLSSLVPTGNIGAADAGHTIAASSSSPLEGANSLLVQGASAFTAGNCLVSKEFAIDREDQAKVMGWSFYYEAVTSNMDFPGTSAGTWAVYIAEVTTATPDTVVSWIQPAGVYNLVQSSGVGIASGTFQTTATGTAYRLVLVCINSEAAATTLKVDDFQLGPQKVLAGAAISDWQSYTPGVIGGFSSAPTVNFARYRRVGANIEVQLKITFTSASNNYIRIVGPTGFTIDSSNAATCGTAVYYVGDAENYTGAVVQDSIGSFLIADADGSSWWNGSLSSPRASTASGHQIFATFSYPVVGLSSNTVMSNDTDTRVVAARYYSTAATSYGNGPTTVTYAVKTQDTHSSFSGTVFTCPVSGTYKVQASIYINGVIASGQNIWLSVRNTVSGVQTVLAAQSYGGSAASQNWFLNGSTEIPMNAGDTYDIRLQTNTTGNQTELPGSASTNNGTVSFERLSGPATIAASETVACRYKNSSGTNIPGSAGVFKYTIKDFDTHGFYSTSTGLATIPVSGKYSVTASLASSFQTLGVQQGLIIELYKNSVVHSRLGVVIGNGNGNLYFTTGSDNVQCVAGDTLAVYATWGAGVAVPSFSDENFNHISIHRVGN